ncbi:unnamed protein product [Spirodela intermedia]|uniref:Uncharacterized protein n=1 Tax=Spirodela intermedia TaxID=51605 RepID=A0A7I8IQ36_SPIIN|nr:unnamed protein product [Spirodela intermedia]CAA6659613.1 unnamed protein product [Spirodela intermedia]
MLSPWMMTLVTYCTVMQGPPAMCTVEPRPSMVL